jgi:hypothetical protein
MPTHWWPPPTAPATACRWDVSKLEPLVAAPHSPDNRKLARECSDVKIDRAYIGSCTGEGQAVPHCASQSAAGAPGTAPACSPCPGQPAGAHASQATLPPIPPHPTPGTTLRRQDRGLHLRSQAVPRSWPAGQGAHLPGARHSQGAQGRGACLQPGRGRRWPCACATDDSTTAWLARGQGWLTARCLPGCRCGRMCTPCPCPAAVARRQQRSSRQPAAPRPPRPAVQRAWVAPRTPLLA